MVMYTAMAISVLCWEKKFFILRFDLLNNIEQHIATIRLVRIVKKLKYLIIVSGIEVTLFMIIR